MNEDDHSLNDNEENKTEPAPKTPEEEAARAIEEAKAAGDEQEAAEEERLACAREEAFRRAEEERLKEQQRTEESIRREKKEAEDAAQAELTAKKQRRKKGLRLTAAVLAIALLVSAAGYAAGTIGQTIEGLKNQVASLEAKNEDGRSGSSKQPETNDETQKATEERTESAADETRKATEESETVTLSHDDVPVIDTAAVSGQTGVMLSDVSDIVEKTLPSVVSITVTGVVSYDSYWGGNRQYTTQGAGSGIIIGDDGNELWVVTNYHVIEDSQTIEVRFCDEESAETYVKGTDKDNDLAVLGVKLDGLKKSTIDSIKVVRIGESDTLKLGQGVIAIGNALGWGQSVTTGVVSALNREVTFEDNTKMYLLQTSAAINPGNSGGALLNANGELIGINNAKYSETDVEGVGFAIPISSVKDIMEELSLMQPRTAVSDEDYPYLGATFKNLSSGYMEATGIPNGAYVYEVGSDTPAEKGGLLAYDVITAFNGARITSYDSLVEEMQYYSGGTEVELTVMRLERGAYKEVTLKITLGYRNDYQN